MFEQIFDQYRKAVESSFEMQQELYRQWMNGLPIKPPDLGSGIEPGAVKEQIRSYQERWSRTLAETLEEHRKLLNQQYEQGIDAISSAFRHHRGQDARGILAVDPGILAQEHRLVQNDLSVAVQVRAKPGQHVA